MNYEGLIIRPPSEAGSLILQVTVGCSHNQCTFCPAYKDKQFRIKPTSQILDEIDHLHDQDRELTRRIFLCDGDPMIMPQSDLLELLKIINDKFKRLQRIGIYANAKSILRKTKDELKALKSKRLGIVYFGLESGDTETLKSVRKGSTPEEMVEAAKRIRQAGIKLNVTVLLGLGGRQRSLIHARETMRVLNRMSPNQIGALTLMLVPGTELHNAWSRGEFELPDKLELVRELREMISCSELDGCLFFSNHASNYFPIKARLARDREKILRELDYILETGDEGLLRDESMRAL